MSEGVSMAEEASAPDAPRHFIKQIIDEDLKAGRVEGVVTRFPPEPNGYLHIGHAKSICLNFGLALEYGGRCHLRFDDTNPEKEDVEYVESIQEDIRWLGFDWGVHLYYASDYFGQLYEWALYLIREGKAFVCDQSAEDFKRDRGSPTVPGTPSPWRDRSVEESLDLLERMKAGEFPDGACTLRAKIDMASPNMHLRDPALYRIKHQHHHRTGDTWCIYPTYDFTHGQSDAIEHVTHSLCSLEFEVHRPLYDWFVENLPVPARPRQTEFAKLIPTYTMMSKRNLRRLVEEGHVDGWNDPRMPTISGLRRRGVTSQAIRNLCERVGVTKYNSLTDLALLEHCIREDLNKTSPRVMAVLNPLKIIIENYPEDQEEFMEAVNNPEDPGAGTRQVPFARELFIERDDFLEDAPKKFFRLAPGREVRLRYAYFITCTEVIKDADGNVSKLRCTYDPATRGGDAPDGRKVKGTLHWVSARHAFQAETRLYDRLFLKENPADVGEGEDWIDGMNPDSLISVTAHCEPSLKSAQPGQRVQFERTGYFCVDTQDSKPDAPVFNRTATLKDTWAKMAKKG
ncbi:MAG: glutamine--tRNA ligase/YqeY domain fusion protein [Opitutales bacterium]